MDSHIYNPNFDKTLAEKLAGVDYGMKSYFFVFLTTGKNTTEEKSKVNEYFRGNMENVNRLVEQEKLIISGPIMKNDKSYRGLFIFNNVTSKDSLLSILETDPAIKNKFLDLEIFTWYRYLNIFHIQIKFGNLYQSISQYNSI